MTRLTPSMILRLAKTITRRTQRGMRSSGRSLIRIVRQFDDAKEDLGPYEGDGAYFSALAPSPVSSSGME